MHTKRPARQKRRSRLLLLTLPAVVLAAAAAGWYYLWAASQNSPAGAAAEGAVAEKIAETEADAEQDPASEPIPVSVVEVARGTVSTYIRSTTNLVPENEVKVLAEAEGRVTRLSVEEGDRVRRGQRLATLLRDEAEIAHHKAQLKSDNAKLAFERASRMLAENLISQQDYDRIAMDHRIAVQELAEAKWRLDKTEIRAPFDGRLTLRSVTLGQHVRPGDELFVVTDFDPLIARIYLPEKDVLRLEEGREVGITLRADPSVGFAGRIRQISPVVDTSTGTVKVTVEALDPPHQVRPGGFVTIDITRETRAATLLVPRDAVIRELNQAHVFVVRGDRAERREVRLGLEEGEQSEALSGVVEGDRVVVAGQGSLKDGSPIRILEDSAERLSAAHESDPSDING